MWRVGIYLCMHMALCPTPGAQAPPLQHPSHSRIDKHSPVCIDDRTRDEVLNALKTNLKVADGLTNKLSLSSGCTVPVGTERVLKQADLTCAEKYCDDDSREARTPNDHDGCHDRQFQYLPLSPEDRHHDIRNAKGLCDPRCKFNAPRDGLGICESNGTADGNGSLARGPSCGVCPYDLPLAHPELSTTFIYCPLQIWTRMPVMPAVPFKHAQDRPYLAPMGVG